MATAISWVSTRSTQLFKHLCRQPRLGLSAICLCVLLFWLAWVPSRPPQAATGRQRSRLPRVAPAHSARPTPRPAPPRYDVYAATATPGTPRYLADNTAQNWQASFTTEGLILQSAGPAPWRLGVRLRSAGYGAQQTELLAAKLIPSSTRLEIEHRALATGQVRLTEWFVNQPHGLEQGFSLAAPPGARAGSDWLRLRLEVTGGWRLTLHAAGQGITLRQGALTQVQYEKLVAYDTRGRRLPARLRVAGEQIYLEVNDAGAVYPLTIDPTFTQFKKLFAPAGLAGDQFGQSLAHSDDTLVIGASDDDSPAVNAGSVSLFERNLGGANNWGLRKTLVAPDQAASDEFGTHVALHGDTLLVGAPSDNETFTDQGSAYLFQRNLGGPDNWSFVKKLTAFDGAEEDFFGIRVALHGDLAVVTADTDNEGFNTQQGSAYLFGRNQGGADNWGLIKKIRAEDATDDQFFGAAVALVNETLIVGADGANFGLGAAYLFERNQGGPDNWGQTKRLVAADGAVDDRFGFWVNLDPAANLVIVTAREDNSTFADQGSAYIFARDQGGPNNWGQVKKLVANDGGSGDFFGNGAAITNDRVVVGAFNHDLPGQASQGAAYVYERNLGGPNNWGQRQKLVAADGAATHLFGFDALVVNDTLLVTALNAPGAAPGTGAAYIFELGPNGTPPSIAATDFDIGSGDEILVQQLGEISAPDFSLTVTVNGGATATVNGITLSNLVLTNDGLLLATATADCTAQSASFTLRVTDNEGQFAEATLNVTLNNDPNTAPTLAYPANTAGFLDQSFSVLPTNGPFDNGPTVQIAVQQVSAGFTGTVEVTPAGVVNLRSAAPAGAHTITIRATDGCGLFTDATVNLTLTDRCNLWTQTRKLKPANLAANNGLGRAVAIDGDTAAATAERALPGRLYIFERNQGGLNNWGVVQTIFSEVLDGSDDYGTALALSGDTLVVGAPGSGGNQALVYQRNQGGANQWGLVKKLQGSDLLGGDQFGIAVSLSGDTLLVGANEEFRPNGSNQGKAYLFARNQGGPNNWGQVKKLVASELENAAQFGFSVALSGDTALIGAPREDELGQDSGAAYLFARNQGGADNWGEIKKLTSSDLAANDRFGQAVALHQDTAAVTALLEDIPGADSGSAYVFERNQGGANNWGEVAKREGTGLAGNDQFGNSAALHGDNLLIGVSRHSNPQSLGGGAFLFNRNQGGANNWGQVIKLQPTDLAALDFFGNAVAIFGKTVIAGAINDDDPADAGAAYIFELLTCNVPPTLAAINLTLGQGAVANNQLVAQVNDLNEPATNLTLQVNGALTATVNGITLGNLASNANGAVTATIHAACNQTTANFTLRATDSGGLFAETELSVTVNDTANTPPELAYANPQTLLVGQTSQINPSTGPHDNGSLTQLNVQSVSAGFLGNVSVNNAGVVTISNAAPVGEHSLTLRATDNCGATTDALLTLIVTCPVLTVLPESLPAGQIGSPYQQTLTQTGGSAPVTFSLTAGALPAGLQLAGDGMLTGTPTVTGNFNFTIRAIDANGCFGERGYTLLINACPALTVLPATLPNGVVAANFQQSLTQTGGTAPLNWTISAGALPDGLQLQPNTGELTGSPTAQGNFNFTVQVKDANNCTGTRSYTLQVDCPEIMISPATLPLGRLNQPYPVTVFTATGGLGPHTFALTGTLPAGLSFAAATLNGTPTEPGEFNLTLTATDAAGCTGQRNYLLKVIERAVKADFDGDGKTDLSVWRGPASNWLVINSADNSLRDTPFGTSNAPFHDLPVPGDYDGDGRTDIAIWRPLDGNWFILNSADDSIRVEAWGGNGDTPVPGDYDGDGKTDLAIWRGATGNWFIRRSSDGQAQVVAWGSSNLPFNDVPVQGDYDGDGRTDLAVFRRANGNWFILRSSDGSFLAQAWGLGTDTPVPSDYDGDGQTDIAVWRGNEGNWFVLQSSDGQFQVTQWGSANVPFNDVPVPGDYDGDGQTDLAVWRPLNGTWFVQRSTDGSFEVTPHGQPGDTPLPAR